MQAARLEVAQNLHQAHQLVAAVLSHICLSRNDAEVLHEAIDRIDAVFSRVIPNKGAPKNAKASR